MVSSYAITWLYSDLRTTRIGSIFLAIGAVAGGAMPVSFEFPANVRTALDCITAAQLKGDLSFLASDALAGRYTPSPGLDVAAEFIASRFRAAGLEAGGNDGYFQTAAMIDRRQPAPSANMTLHDGDKTFTITARNYVVLNSSKAEKITNARAAIFPVIDIEALKKTDVTGKAVVIAQPEFNKLPSGQRLAAYQNMRAFERLVAASKAAIEIVVINHAPSAPRPALMPAEELPLHQVAAIAATDNGLEEWFQHAQGTRLKTVTVDVPAPQEQAFTGKNVIGILRGSDPKLKDAAVLLTAHYDHIGTMATAAGLTLDKPKPNDQIFNGANDDGSGTVSVIEIASALAHLDPHPKRSLIFMTFFGEERGELGSRYYGKHPVFPIAKTVADINLEQVGRTDELDNGKIVSRVNSATLTGFDYSDVTKFLEQAGKELGVNVYKDNEASDAYFTRSDNDALAQQGVPAHSLTVAFDYPDYHGLGDEWQKIDYENMARVDRMVALGLLGVANAEKAPEWNTQNSKTVPFREARKQSIGADK